ncbi:MAG TPA: YMGG-like glycine zipper-containing protein [Gemmatimonadaceae bacterium]
MFRKFSTLVLGFVIAVAACSRHDSKADSALAQDLSLAAQSKGLPLDSLSAEERAAAFAGTAPRTSTAPAPVRRTVSTTRRSTSSGTRSAGRVVTVKHTKRDAAIGAVAGAIIGAGTSRNKVKGGVIGAAVGGVLGAVVGNTVDKERRRVP